VVGLSDLGDERAADRPDRRNLRRRRRCRRERPRSHPLVVGGVVAGDVRDRRPICDKLVVAAIGVSGALSYWAPLQPLLGALGTMVLLTGLTVRLRHQACCPVPAR